MIAPGVLRYLGLIVEGLLFGLYSGILGLHLQHYAHDEGTDKVKYNLTHYALCMLYVLSMALISIDVALFPLAFFTDTDVLAVSLRISECQIAVFGCCDFIAQFNLIYRSWIVWGRNTRVVIIPSTLAFAYFVMWIAQTGAIFIVPGGYIEASWGNTLALAALTASMTVNGLVSGLIVLKIFKVFRLRSIGTTSAEKSLGVTSTAGGKLRSIIFVIIESALALFAIQLTRLIMVIIILRLDSSTTVTATLAGVYNMIVFIHEMLNGIAPTIILVRVSMGFSFHDKQSLEESIGSLRFAADNRNPMPGMGTIDSVDGPDSFNLNIGPDEGNPIPPETEDIPEERRDKDLDIGCESDEIQTVDR